MEMTAVNACLEMRFFSSLTARIGRVRRLIPERINSDLVWGFRFEIQPRA